ncbi:MAG: DUF1850 domain-containing protein [Planctomycetes bacterium]|nr:DUF1850 domain-containing protein [Planctomycetota bacterium]
MPILAVWWYPAGLELVITPKDGGEPILALPLEPGERFTLHYIHSVDRAPIWEEHSADRDGNICVEEERFVMFGAGMGHWPGHGTLTSRGPYQVIENIHAPIGEFILRVGTNGVDHTIIWRGKHMNLSRIAAGRAVVVSARPLSLPGRLWDRWNKDDGLQAAEWKGSE